MTEDKVATLTSDIKRNYVNDEDISRAYILHEKDLYSLVILALKGVRSKSMADFKWSFRNPMFISENNNPFSSLAISWSLSFSFALRKRGGAGIEPGTQKFEVRRTNHYAIKAHWQWLQKSALYFQMSSQTDNSGRTLFLLDEEVYFRNTGAEALGSLKSRSRHRVGCSFRRLQVPLCSSDWKNHRFKRAWFFFCFFFFFFSSSFLLLLLLFSSSFSFSFSFSFNFSFFHVFLD